MRGAGRERGERTRSSTLLLLAVFFVFLFSFA
jgi:hypothetical protein